MNGKCKKNRVGNLKNEEKNSDSENECVFHRKFRFISKVEWHNNSYKIFMCTKFLTRCHVQFKAEAYETIMNERTDKRMNFK